MDTLVPVGRLYEENILFKIECLFLAIATLFFLILPLPGTIPVLMYHFVDTPERAAVEKNVVSRKSFERQMRFLKAFGYRVLSMDEYYEIQMGLRKPKGREVVITFDDGNYTYYDYALPILNKYDLPSTMFIVSENVSQEIHGSMTWDQIKEVAANKNVILGSHTKTHPLLANLTTDEAQVEIRGSKLDLEKKMPYEMHYFAYPSGNLDSHVVEIAKASGYRLAFTTGHKKLGDVPEGLFSKTRVKISRTSDSLVAFWVKISGIYGGFKGLKHRFFRS